MLHRLLSVAVVGAFLVVANSLSAVEIKSGPQPGDKLAGPFHPLNINGAKAGEKFCLYCVNGNNPVAMIFARKPTKELQTLISKIDAATEANSGAKMGSFVVFCADETDQLKKELESAAKDLKKCVLSIDQPSGPKGYDVAKEAEVTVILYKERKCVANHTFASSSDLNDKAIAAIMADVEKLVK
jgi:hypothetical protein